MRLNWLKRTSARRILFPEMIRGYIIVSVVVVVGLIIVWKIWNSSIPSGDRKLKEGIEPQFLPYNPEKVEWELLGMLGYINKTDPSIEADLMEAEVENAVRVQRVRDLCRKFHMGKYHLPNSSRNDLGIPEMSSPRYETRDFYLLRKWGFSYCVVHKAGCTSMQTNLLLLDGYESYEQVQLQVKIRKSHIKKLILISYPENNGNFATKSQEIEDSVKVLVVRHPFDRLISAYNDRLFNASRHPSFLKTYGPIIRKYRRDSRITQVEPTWTEFVEYLLNSPVEEYDEHWRPIFNTCTPCLVNYDIIAKIETYSRDQAYFIHKLDLTPLKEPIWGHQHQTLTDRKDRAQDYFGQLTKTRIRGLVKIYLMDFLLFDYNINKDYMEYGKEED